MAKYMMVVWEAGTPLPGKERKLAPREVPDVVKLGGPEQFARLMDELRIIVPAVGRSI